MEGPVEVAVRAAVTPGSVLQTPSANKPFTVARFTTDNFVLLLGQGEHWTALPWEAIETVPGLLRGRGWVKIGGQRDTRGEPNTLDAHLKRYLKRDTARWVAVLLEAAGVVDLDRARPAKVALARGW